MGYVARLLNEYYTATNEPAGLTDLNQKAAAVQAAIWLFSDRYVLNTSSPLYGTVVGIVNHIRAEGALVEPPAPSLTLDPAACERPQGQRGRAVHAHHEQPRPRPPPLPERPGSQRPRDGLQHVLELGRHGSDS
ncbi:MAG TPA: hypothetical protein VI456_14415 [Polyangia bacterium]